MLSSTVRRVKQAIRAITEMPPVSETEQPNDGEDAGVSQFSDRASADEVKAGVYEGTHYPSGMYVPKCTYYPTCLLQVMSSEHIPR